MAAFQTFLSGRISTFGDTLEAYARPVVKLDYPRLGKRLRGDVKRVQAAIDAGEYTAIDDGARLRVAGYELEPEDFTVRYEAANAQLGVAAEGALVVVVDLTIEPALLIEKQVRDLNRGLQDLRKAAGLRYEERVEIAVVGPAPLLDAMDGHLAWIAEQTLAVGVARAPLEAPLARAEIDVAGEQVEIMLRRAGATPARD